ncbi:1,4-dihydroxy-2-naphthoate prenyltransferase [Paramagnetospirillum kuznetsovii]|uniref:1,4-dihydroxy-2-naphthoate prenyltransferase n=2 Tax=Paramagnetospirillum kuznetsovii TaxID=2053833 RepID=A0A364P140_9PROT|nr:1,4-dihydroxy-2-naphthoate prenyltransferase [Paramagnetospirillum kuznetsovii]
MSPLIRRLFLATRPMFFPASAVPVAVGTAWGLRDGAPLSPVPLLLALVGMACLHAGANVINDVGDALNGSDRLNTDRIPPFTGGSRVIQDGLLGLRAMALWGCVLLLAGAAVGGSLVASKGLTILVFGLVGGGLALAYSLPPFSLASRGLGEAAVALGFGLPVAASAWLQSGTFSLVAILAAATVGCWTAAILICNEVPDIKADEAAGKRTLVVRMGAKSAPSIYVAVQALASALMLAQGWLSEMPPWATVPPLLTVLAALAAAPLMMGGRGSQLAAIRVTLAIHLLGGIWLTAAALV